VFYLRVYKTKRPRADIPQKALALTILCLLLQVNRAIHFDHQGGLVAVEIYNKTANTLLVPEMIALVSFSPKMLLERQSTHPNPSLKGGA
jgi:hypothetical protein